MIENLASKASDSLWRKVGEKAVITAVTTLLSEAIKASVEVVKKSKLMEQKADFDDRRAREKKAREPDEPQSEEEDADEADDEVDAAESPKGDDTSKSGPKISFAEYLARRDV
ncbi:hypothetical protein FIV42_12970 [Persicimonas caeni]|uniref:Uncharacterized protein n=1 Tax=Persicimonas caeni TaxID=2292766 RepID=A0A4Y6PTH0_PERCE|nr:hypothetical protein [Persicimonas caeni]QDG51626.1 hypothetical protein FIV42_12970 [Persicimonas caeni]QED32847.1 hypothetical protein FRD00_12965 [Persicimonas caeni]